MNSLEKPHWRLLLDPGHFLSFGFGSGLSPIAPGTIGSMLAIPIALFMNQTFISYRLILLGFLIVLGIYLCGRSASLFKNHDHSSIVFDEIVGMLVPLFFIPFNFLNVFNHYWPGKHCKFCQPCRLRSSCISCRLCRPPKTCIHKGLRKWGIREGIGEDIWGRHTQRAYVKGIRGKGLKRTIFFW